MVFSSALFLFAFLPITYILYISVRSLKIKNFILMVASLVFYSFGRLDWLALLILSVLCNYGAGLMMQKGDRIRRISLCISVFLNLGILFAFKYLNFFTGLLSHIPFMGIEQTEITLPIGISFFTFQGMSYVIDVYRNPSMASKSFGKVLLYIAFFPQLVAGPIVKYGDISHQIDSRNGSGEDTVKGIERFVTGLVKKLFFANVLGFVADGVYGLEASLLDMRLAWLGALCYTLQIYYDFSAYSDMAIGLGGIFGFKINENFAHPYVSSSIKEFWRRWHISLSAWFREYLYIPLGGNRKGVWRARLNRLMVFFFTGMWHGANWTFILWGLWHGLFLFLEDAFKKKIPAFAGHIYTMLAVVLGFVLFRADSVGQAFSFAEAMFTGFDFSRVNTALLCKFLTPSTVFTLLAGIIFVMPVKDFVIKKLQIRGMRIPAFLKLSAVMLVFILCVIKLAASSFNPFIYTQF